MGDKPRTNHQMTAQAERGSTGQRGPEDRQSSGSREDAQRVSAIRTAVDSGEYHIQTEAVAEAMMARLKTAKGGSHC